MYVYILRQEDQIIGVYSTEEHAETERITYGLADSYIEMHEVQEDS